MKITHYLGDYFMHSCIKDYQNFKGDFCHGKAKKNEKEEEEKKKEKKEQEEEEEEK